MRIPIISRRFGQSTALVVTAAGLVEFSPGLSPSLRVSLNQDYKQICLEQIRNTEDLCNAFRQAGDMRDQYFFSEEFDQHLSVIFSTFIPSLYNLIYNGIF